MRLSALLVLALLIVAGAALFTYADPTPPLELDPKSSSSRLISNTSNGSIAAQGGNITALNINALGTTNTWAGYYGNITGNLRLDDAKNQSFYSWGNSTASGEVYASRNDTVYWLSVNCTNATERSAEDAYLGVAATNGDSATTTFNTTNDHPQFYMAGKTILGDSCFSTNANVNGNPQNTSFYQIMLSDDNSTLVYTTIIEDGEVGFNGEAMDFQLMVAENEQPGNEGPTNYYFWVELD